MQAARRRFKDGFLWLRDGAKLIRQQPFGLIWLVLVLMMSSFVGAAVFGEIALLAAKVSGGVNPQTAMAIGARSMTVLVPGLTMGFYEGCARAWRGERIDALSLFRPFMRSKTISRRLLALGLLQMVWLSASIAIVGIDPNGPLVDTAPMAFLLAMVGVMTILAWFVPMLLVWGEVPLFKALFFNAAAVWRNRVAFLGYVCCAALVAMLPSIVQLILDSVGIAAPNALVLLIPAFLLAFTILLCGNFASYLSVFGPEAIKSDPSRPARS